MNAKKKTTRTPRTRKAKDVVTDANAEDKKVANKAVKKAVRKATKKATKKAKASRKPPSAGFSFADIEGDAKLKKLGVKYEIVTAEMGNKKDGYRIPFNNVALQSATGGIIGGTFAEFGAQSQGGKSFLAYELMANCQAMGGVVMLNDGEGAFDVSYADMVGLNITDGTFIKTRITNIQKYYAFLINMTEAVRKKKKNIPILSVCDSYPTLNTQFAIDKRGSGEQLGHEAKLKNRAWSEQMETFTPFLEQTMSTHIMINQFTKVEVANKYMNPYVSLCEEKMQYWATQRLKGMLRAPLTVTKNIGGKDVKVQIGARTAWKTIKNRSVKPFQEVVVDILYSKGLVKYSGFLGYLFQHQLATIATSKFCAETGEELSKSTDYIKILPKLCGEEDVRLPYNKKVGTSTNKAFAKLIEDYPDAVEPVWTGTYDDGETYEPEDGFSEEETEEETV